MARRIRTLAVVTLVLLVPGFWAAGWVYPSYDSGGGLGRMGPGYMSLCVTCLGGPLALVTAAFVIASAVRLGRWPWLAVITGCVAFALIAPLAYAILATPPPSAPLQTTYIPLLLFFAAAVLAILYARTVRA